MQDTSLFIVSRDLIALSIRYNLRAITLSVPQEFSSLECLAEALSGNCCQKRRAPTRFGGSAGWWVIYFETCCSGERARGREWKDTLSHHQFTCSRRSLLFSHEGKDTRIIYMRDAMLILDLRTFRYDVMIIRQKLKYLII